MEDDFADAQKIIYELKAGPESYPYDEQNLYYQEGVPTAESKTPFVRLLGGKEPLVNMERRYELFQSNWQKQQERIDEVLEESDRAKLDSLREFLMRSGEEDEEQEKGKLVMPGGDWRVPCAMMNLGSNTSNHGRLLQQVYDYLNETQEQKGSNWVVVRMNTAICNNIKACMKMISYGIVSSLRQDGEMEIDEEDSDEDDQEEDEEAEDGDNMNDMPLIFTAKVYRDLPEVEELIEQLAERAKKLVVLVEDADSLPTGVLVQLLRTLWRSSSETRNVRLVIGISTPLLIFQEKIPRLLLSILRTKTFKVDNSTEAISQIMENLLLNIDDTYNSLIFEPRLVLDFLKRRSQIGVSQFYDYMKLIYMEHYYSQPLSILWTDDFSGIELTKEYFDVFKRLPSLRKTAASRDESGTGVAKFYRGIVEDDESAIGSFLRLNLNKLIDWRFNLKNLLDLLNVMQQKFYDLQVWKNNLELFERIFEGYDYENVYSNVSNFDFLKPIFMNMQNMPEKFTEFMAVIKENPQFQFLWQPRSEDSQLDEYFKKLQTKDPGVTKKDIEEFTRHLNDRLTRQLVELNLDNQPFKELCCIGLDVTRLLQNAFNPPVRNVVTDALLNPKAYLLNSVHSEGRSEDDELLKLMDPSMAELFRLYREAGVVINIYDFYEAFENNSTDREKLVGLLLRRLRSNSESDGKPTKEETLNMESLQKIEEGGTEGETEWEKMALSWFQKGLVELELLGFLKEGKNKSEVVEKLVWKGI